MILLVIAAIIIILLLAFYAGKLLWQLKHQTRDQKRIKQKHQLALQKHDSNVLESVAIIVKALQEQQCDLSEGCWRLSVLLDSLKTTSGLAAKFPAIYGLYNEIKDMAILENRKKLAKKQRMRDDYNRLKYEAQYQDAIMQDLALLAEFTDDQIVNKLH